MVASIKIPTKILTLNSNDRILLIADNNKYLSWIAEGHNEYIAAEKSKFDQNCQFIVAVQDDLTIALKADNGKWLSRISDAKGNNYIQPLKAEIDKFCKFVVMQLCNAEDRTYLALKADNGNWWSRISGATAEVAQYIEPAKPGIDQFCLFSVEHLG